ncbi:MAG: hypothetical protein H8E41_06145 [Desulfobulbaceae bacterium]|uniref:Glycine/sarcosine/betaine reductase complex selenoprotein A n=1 Tax=Candidatus Desulfobia pelagia TaxID=2841692 RepID=A0A8J6TFK4_9BACT|nr:hypothetical protein [Candidatus Desulfobia pelagia]
MKKLAEKHGTENLIVVLGINQLSTIQIMTRTFKSGDPSYAGPLAGVSLGLDSYHILELKDHIPADVWEQEMGMYELEIEEEAQENILKIMKEARQY